MKIPKPSQKVIDFLLVLAFVAVMYALKMPCLFKTVFTVECPGCGITRAWIRFLHLDIKQAFQFNPMFWSVPLVLTLYLFEKELTKYRTLISVVLSLIHFGFFLFWLRKFV